MVSAVLEEQLAGARAAQLMRVLTAADVAAARQKPETVARRHGLETATLSKLLAGELDTVPGGCTDHLAGPHSPAGEPCRASFLLCLSCPCARATPDHLPVLVALQEGLEARKQEMTPLRWTERFAGPVAQLADLLASFPSAAIARTRTEVTAEQRAPGRAVPAPRTRPDMILPDTAPATSAPLLPGPDTLVLLNRPTRPGTDPSTLSVFADQITRLFPAQHDNLNVLGGYSFRASVPAAARARCAITTRPGSTMTMREGCASASARSWGPAEMRPGGIVGQLFAS
ncbi:hypothetical protein ABTY00_36885 [Streptomyces microflavus]|uniref:hypothetical protein n=1 Tax=Streptomyces microflavus TaxID=1919 RepID=UPI00332D853D